MSYPEIYLKKHEDKRLRQGHLWIFSNEIDVQRSPFSHFSPGQLVNIIGYDGKTFGTAYFNPNTLIAARLLSRKTNLKCDLRFFKTRIENALSLREQLFSNPYYRLIFGESDGLPGLVVDRYGSVLAVQITTAGMEALKSTLVTALVELINPDSIIFKNDNSLRTLEGLGTETEALLSPLPSEILIEENGARFSIDVINGQKTGWFYDHRMARQRLANIATNKRVLDLFSYIGAWGIPAALYGATEVTCVDASESAVALTAQNAQLNQVASQMRFIRSDVFDYLKQARLDNEHFDIIVLDPPALIKRKKDFKQGYEAYRRLNELALQVLMPKGILVSASCSYHLSSENLHEILRASARHIDRHIAFFDQTGQGPDHPVHPAIPETNYLKTFFCSISPSL